MAVLEIAVDEDLLSQARKVADLDRLSVEQLALSALRHHVEYIAAVSEFADMPPFSLDNYELQRDADETDEEFEIRLGLFM